MKKTLPAKSLFSLPDGASCERCARCLSVCPSYQFDLSETMSPRGRWELVRAASRDELKPGARSSASFSRCLQCMACLEACPKGVNVPEAVLLGRQAMPKASLRARIRGAAMKTLLRIGIPRRELMAGLARTCAPLSQIFPKHPSGSRHLPLFLPDILAGRRVPDIAAKSLFQDAPEVFPALTPEPRGEVTLFTGCIFGLVDPAPARAAITALTAWGYAVRLPKGQGCCAAPAHYSGLDEIVAPALSRNLDALLSADTPVLSICATCGNTLSNVYPRLAQGADRERALELSKKVQDCCAFLAGLPREQAPFAPPSPVFKTLVAIHDPCHLARGMGVFSELRQLLGLVPGVQLVDASGSGENTCCGGGGLSGLKHPDQANAIGRKRAKQLLDTGAQVVVTPCPGCIMQLRDQFSRLNANIPVLHPLEFIADKI